MSKYAYGYLLIFLYAMVALGIAYGMSTTANNDPQAVCLTRPWLDVKPPC
jgi:hypothetical protein